MATASDGEEALRIAFAVSSDLILLDMLLPKLSGPEVLRALRKHPLTQKTPIIVMSGLSLANEKKLMQEGADAYFQKSGVDLDAEGDSIIKTIEKIFAKFEKKKTEEVPHC